MACFADENTYSDLDCDCFKCEHFCCYGFICYCCCDEKKRSWKCLHHTASAICASVLALVASISLYFWLSSNVIPSDKWAPCEILFATYGNDSIVQPNTGVSPQACQYVLVGDLVVFFGALVLIVWFWVKARLGCGAKMELCTALLQIVLLLPMLIFAISSGIILTAGLDHTCSSNATPIQFPCSELRFYADSVQSTSTDFYTGMKVIGILVWVEAGLVFFLLLFPSLLSVVCTCIKHCLQSYNNEKRNQPLHSTTQIATPNTAAAIPLNQSTPIQQQTLTYTVHPVTAAQTSAPIPSAQTQLPPALYPIIPSQPLAQASSQLTAVMSQPVSVQSESPPSSEHLWPALGESLHRGHHGIHDLPIPKLSPAAHCNTLQVLKLFTLPCHYTPLFGSCRVQAHIKSIQEKHNVEFALLDLAGISTAIQSLDRTISESFFAQTSGTGVDGIKKVEDCLSDYLTPSVLMKFIWLWQNDQGPFSPFDPDVNATLEANYNATPKSPFNCRVRNKSGMWDYTIDFASMTQTNRQTGRKRRIKYEAVAITWQYKNSQENYVSHSPTHSEAIERMYVSGQQAPLSIQGKTFTFNFDSMVQIGTAGSQVIHRVTSPVTVPTASYELKLQAQGPSASSLDVAVSDLKKELKSFLCSKEHRISTSSGLQSSMTILNRTVQTVLLQRARHYFVSTLISARKIELHGTHEQVDKVLLLLQQLLLAVEKQAIPAIDVPPTWFPQTRDFALVQVNRNTSEWTRVTGLLFTTLPNAQIHRLDRIQNLWLWEKYGFAKQRMMKKNSGNINEKELFHGTRGTHPKEIFKSEHGFDFRCASQGLWGEGAYFAVKASYSDSYAYHSADKRQMIVAKVLTGYACYLSQNDTTLKQPPVKPSSSRSSAGEAFHEERYDTVHGCSNGSDIHVIYDHDKAYPAYLITYQGAT